MNESAAGSTRIADIEVLRAIAVLYVVLHHANGVLFPGGSPLGPGFFAWFGGWVGVDLFFVISGFVIARVLLVQMSGVATAREFLSQAGAFWIRRAFRLLPLAWFWLVAILVLAAFFNDSGVFGSVSANVQATLAGVLQFANWRFASTFGRVEYGASFVYWSLSLEEQFYIVLPVLIVLLRRRLPWLLGMVVLLQLGEERGLFGMAFRTDALCLGVLAALFVRSPWQARLRARIEARRGTAALAMGALAILLAVLGSPALQGFEQRVGAIALTGTAMVLLASANADVLAGVVPGPVARALLWAGSRSYAIYLVHVPVYFAVREAAYRAGVDVLLQPWTILCAAALAIVILAEAGFRWIEAPWRERGRAVAGNWLGRRGEIPAASTERGS